MSQHDFNIGNQLFPATRTDLNNALVALASNSSGTSAPSTTYANQFWYETDTNKLKIRNESNSAWIEIATLDQSGGTVQSIATSGLTLGSTAISATGAEINQLDALTRGSILYGNASGATARLAAGSANKILTSDGTDISWQTPVEPPSGATEFISTSGVVTNASAISFTGFNSSKYVSYFFELTDVRSNQDGNYNVVLYCSLATSGTSYDKTVGNYHAGSNTDTAGFYLGNQFANQNMGQSGQFRIHNPHATAYTVSKTNTANSRYNAQTTIMGRQSTDARGAYLNTGSVTACQFWVSNADGNATYLISSGEVRMDGVKKS